MTYVIVTGKKEIASKPFFSFDAAYRNARERFGIDIEVWLGLNLRIEENR